jgi:hypothetical protein
MKTNKSSERIGTGFFQLSCPEDCTVEMKKNVSKIGIYTGGCELTGLGTNITTEGGFLLADTTIFIIALYATEAAGILTGTGGILLAAEWISFFPLYDTV